MLGGTYEWLVLAKFRAIILHYVFIKPVFWDYAGFGCKRLDARNFYVGKCLCLLCHLRLYTQAEEPEPVVASVLASDFPPRRPREKIKVNR
jgi:hypothetical protein